MADRALPLCSITRFGTSHGVYLAGLDKIESTLEVIGTISSKSPGTGPTNHLTAIAFSKPDALSG
jgi:hypothetical protein